MNRFNGKTAVITGGNSGIGLATGDILLRYEGACLNKPDDLIQAVAKVPADHTATLEIRRDGKARSVTPHGGKMGIGIDVF